MEQKELVKRQSVSYDGRLKKIVLTDKSRAISHLITEDMALVESIITEGFSPEEIDAMCDYIERMKKNIKNYKLKEE